MVHPREALLRDRIVIVYSLPEYIYFWLPG